MMDTGRPVVRDECIGGDASTELSSNRTSLSFERTKMSMDRTLMSVMRTAISLIGFGFTIAQVFAKAAKIPGAQLPENAPRNFGLSLIVMGILILVWGIGTHIVFSRALAARGRRLHAIGLVRSADKPKPTMVTFVATALLLLGILVLFSLVVRVGPYAG